MPRTVPAGLTVDLISLFPADTTKTYLQRPGFLYTDPPIHRSLALLLPMARLIASSTSCANCFSCFPRRTDFDGVREAGPSRAWKARSEQGRQHSKIVTCDVGKIHDSQKVELPCDVRYHRMIPRKFTADAVTSKTLQICPFSVRDFIFAVGTYPEGNPYVDNPSNCTENTTTIGMH